MRIINFFIFVVVIVFCTSCHQAAKYQNLEISTIQKSNILIAIDPGHGGKDGGASSSNKKYHEKHFCLSTALLLQKYLEKMGYSTIMTRDSDVFIPLNKRAQIANQANANIFISIHYNAAKNLQARGLEVYFNDYIRQNNKVEKSKALAKDILTNMLTTTKEPSRGVKVAAFVVLVNTNMPAVLVEGGFLTNKQDLAQIKRATYWDKIARGIARGVDEYVTEN